MAKKGYTNKPCIGCGAKGERRKDALCYECLGLLETGKMHNKLYCDLSLNPDIIEISIPKSWCTPRFYANRSSIRSDYFDKIGKILAILSQRLSMHNNKHPAWSYRCYLENRLDFADGSAKRNAPIIFQKKAYDWQKGAIIPKDIFELLTELHNSIVAVLDDVEEKGVSYGKNALMQLSNGDITIDEFNSK